MQALSKKGFTLIELLVVVAIIGILSSVVMVSLNSARAKATAAKATADASQVMTAIEMANSDGCTSLTLVAESPVACTTPVTTQYLQRLPVQPTGYTYSFPPSPLTTLNNYIITISGFASGQTFTCSNGSCYCNVNPGCTQ